MSKIKFIEVNGEILEVVSLADLGLDGFIYSFTRNPFDGYVISKKGGHVYSNKRFGKYMKIGSFAPNGRERVTIANTAFYVDELYARALPLFKEAKETGTTVATVQAPARSGVFKKFAVSAVSDGDGLSFATKPKLHDSRKSAEDEALRLAQSQPGTRFAVCEVVSTVCVGDVYWEKA